MDTSGEQCNWTLSVTLSLTINETLKLLLSSHSGGGSAALGTVSLFPHHWDLSWALLVPLCLETTQR